MFPHVDAYFQAPQLDAVHEAQRLTALPFYGIFIIVISFAPKKDIDVYLRREPLCKIGSINTTIRSSKMARALNLHVSVERQSLDGNACADLSTVSSALQSRMWLMVINGLY